MKQFLSQVSKKLNSRFVFPSEGRFALVVKSFSPRENQIFFTAVATLAITTVILLAGVSYAYTVKVPAPGGSITEGVLNTPAHINPLLATSEIGTEADRDLTALIYSGLLRADGDNGFTPDLAERYEVSKDGLTYTFFLKPNLVWHDGEKITASDVVFTIKTTQDGRFKSPKRANWDGVGVEQLDAMTVRFTLTKPYAPFLENATMGILPEHIWGTIDYNRFDTNKYNREPIGSGPYKFSSMKTATRDGDEIPVSYTLKSFSAFALGKPRINTITFVFFGNEDDLMQAIKDGTVDAVNSISSENARKLETGGFRVEHTPLPRVLAVFFNQNEQPLFTSAAVRKALSLAVDKKSIINNVLSGYGVLLDSPIPPETLGYETTQSPKAYDEQLDDARALLVKDGWGFASSTNSWTKTTKKVTQTLTFDLATSEATELKAVAQELKNSWEKLGVLVNVRVFATGDLKETIIRPRKFDALFFGQVLGQGGDPYPFWHSSQRLDPGLNITSYVNTKVDKLLEVARTETNSTKRASDYSAFSNEVTKDNPAIFIYAPEFLYVLPEKVQNLSLKSITVPADRFLNVYQWYINTDNVWKIFAPRSEE